MTRGITPSGVDARFMGRALQLAARARNLTSPNPMVGAVVVRDGRVVGEGYHRRAGGPHAEILALRRAGARSRGATLYVTLEPCTHLKKRTPPCVPAVLAAGLRRVVVAMADPNPQVAGRGITVLRRAGMRVTVGCLSDEAEKLNSVYCHWRRTGRPWVILKAGMTLDGKIATARGESRWITSDAARRHAHALRHRADAVLVGIATVLQDDPELTARTDRGLADKQPLRVVLDSRLRIPETARLLHAKGGRVIVATTRRAPARKVSHLTASGVDVMVLPAQGGRVSPMACLRALAKREVSLLLVEGGSEVHRSLLDAQLADEVVLYIAPLLLGGQDARGMIGGVSPRRLSDAVKLGAMTSRRLGSDLAVRALIEKN